MTGHPDIDQSIDRGPDLGKAETNAGLGLLGRRGGQALPTPLELALPDHVLFRVSPGQRLRGAGRLGLFAGGGEAGLGGAESGSGLVERLGGLEALLREALHPLESELGHLEVGLGGLLHTVSDFRA